MTRKAHLETHLTSSELKQQYQSASDKVESRRWHLLWLVSEHWTIEQARRGSGDRRLRLRQRDRGEIQQIGSHRTEEQAADRQHKRCILHDMQAQIAALTNFHWWSHPEAPKTG
jgi:hypothetical protein